jgi:hypothetical protein
MVDQKQHVLRFSLHNCYCLALSLAVLLVVPQEGQGKMSTCPLGPSSCTQCALVNFCLWQPVTVTNEYHLRYSVDSVYRVAGRAAIVQAPVMHQAIR